MRWIVGVALALALSGCQSAPRCEVHDEPVEVKTVPVENGLCFLPGPVTRQELFPNTGHAWVGSSLEPGREETRTVWICEACEAAESVWCQARINGHEEDRPLERQINRDDEFEEEILPSDR